MKSINHKEQDIRLYLKFIESVQKYPSDLSLDITKIMLDPSRVEASMWF